MGSVIETPLRQCLIVSNLNNSAIDAVQTTADQELCTNLGRGLEQQSRFSRGTLIHQLCVSRGKPSFAFNAANLKSIPLYRRRKSKF